MSSFRKLIKKLRSSIGGLSFKSCVKLCTNAKSLYKVLDFMIDNQDEFMELLRNLLHQLKSIF